MNSSCVFCTFGVESTHSFVPEDIGVGGDRFNAHSRHVGRVIEAHLGSFLDEPSVLQVEEVEKLQEHDDVDIAPLKPADLLVFAPYR